MNVTVSEAGGTHSKGTTATIASNMDIVATKYADSNIPATRTGKNIGLEVEQPTYETSSKHVIPSRG